MSTKDRPQDIQHATVGRIVHYYYKERSPFENAPEFLGPYAAIVSGLHENLIVTLECFRPAMPVQTKFYVPHKCIASNSDFYWEYPPHIAAAPPQVQQETTGVQPRSGNVGPVVATKKAAKKTAATNKESK